VAKLSRADLAAYLATGRTGATTVAATMVAAHAAGIEVFATGGIGGVHAGAETSFDISADLHELARTPVAVVAAGAKAILDLPKTLELLETLGVPVIGHGTDVFPAFWSRESGLRAPLRADSPAEIAAILRTHGAIGGGGLLVANPVPAEHEVPAARLAPLIAQAQAEAVAEGVTGKAVTPWLLARLAALTEGRTLDANRALIVDNARLATRIAAELCRPF
jgi:pseudouridine-5'-phosphate glycosidase